MGKICCGFGHRELYKDIYESLCKAVEYAYYQGCDLFYTGDMGEFDDKFASAVRRLKSEHEEVKLVCIKPYMTIKLNENKEFYYERFDDIEIPTELADTHYKKIITKRNEWMVDQSDIAIFCVYRDFGGAYNTLKYAQKTGVEIIII